MEKSLRGIAFWREVRALPSEQAIAQVEIALSARLEAGSFEEYLERRFANRTPTVMEAHAVSGSILAYGYPAHDPFVSRCLRFLATHDRERALHWLDRLAPYLPDGWEIRNAAQRPLGKSPFGDWKAEEIHPAMLAYLRQQIEAEAWHVQRVRELEQVEEDGFYQLEVRREQLDPSSPKRLAEERALIAMYQKRYGAHYVFRDAWVWWADFDAPDKGELSNREYLPELLIEAAQEDELSVLAVVKAHDYLYGWVRMDDWAIPLAERLSPERLPFVVGLLDCSRHRLGTATYQLLVQAAQQFIPAEYRYPLYEVTFRQIGEPREVYMGGLRTLYPSWEAPLMLIVRDLPELPSEHREQLQAQILQVVALMRDGGHDSTRKLARYLWHLPGASDSLKTFASELHLTSLVASVCSEAVVYMQVNKILRKERLKYWRRFIRLHGLLVRLGEARLMERWNQANSEIQVIAKRKRINLAM